MDPIAQTKTADGMVLEGRGVIPDIETTRDHTLLAQGRDSQLLEYINTVEDIASVFSHLTNCDPYRDMPFAEVNGETVSLSRVWWIQENATCTWWIG